MKLLITGSSGFIGTSLVKYLKTKGHLITTYDITQNPKETLDNLPLLRDRLKGIDLVYHFAGISNPQSPDLHRVNVIGTKNLLNSISKLKQNTKVIFASTFGVYKIPKKGEIVDEKFPLDPRNDYGKSKIQAEKLFKDTKNLIFRITNVYGPGMPPGMHSVVSNFIKAISEDKELTLTDKEATRDFIYIDDLVKCLALAVDSKKSGIVNICSGKETKISDLILLIEKKMKKKAKVIYAADSVFSGNWKGSYRKAYKYFSWKPKINMIQGVTKTIDYFRS